MTTVKKTPTRIYTVHEDGSHKHRLVRAVSAAQAIGYVTRAKFKAHVPTQQELVTALQSGIAVEDAGVSEDE